MSERVKRQYIAHSCDDGKRIQPLKEHLLNTAKLSEENAVSWCKAIAYEAGMAHDIGKYSDAFQSYINGNTSMKTEHAASGAQEFNKLLKEKLDMFFLYSVLYCITGHHSGLPDGGTKVDMDDEPTLSARLKRRTEDYSAYSSEVSVSKPDIKEVNELFQEEMKKKNNQAIIELYAFYTRYLFSCLTDADFIDTERFFSPEAQRGIKGDFLAAYKCLDNKFKSFDKYYSENRDIMSLKERSLLEARNSLRCKAVDDEQNMQDINILTMPTGSGKTLTAFKLAMDEMLRDKTKKRIIYVIPYTSIIEQTADTLSKILGETVYVLQHHSNYNFEKEEKESEELSQKLKRTCENWDAPIVVTTSVQFFQSIYDYRSGRLRKLHNLADSIMIFDEIHMIPLEYLQPCMRGIMYITKYLNSKAILLSATMPNYNSFFKDEIPELSMHDMMTDKSDFKYFENCTYKNLGEVSLEGIAQRAQEYSSSLIIVNTRREAKRLYDMIEAKKFHLSSYMTPIDRSRVIKEIKNCLGKEKIIVVSTSLVEAGVDLDFEAVFRELAGLESILQAGGRCNREGRRDTGSVFVFDTNQKLKGDLAVRAQISKEILKGYEDIASPECISEYYKRLLEYSRKKIMDNSIAKFNGQRDIKSIPFRSYAESFEYIKSDTIGVVINLWEESKKLVKGLEFGEKSSRRKLQRYTVPLYVYELEQLQKLGVLRDYNGVMVLTNDYYYDHDTGLDINKNSDNELYMS